MAGAITALALGRVLYALPDPLPGESFSRSRLYESLGDHRTISRDIPRKDHDLRGDIALVLFFLRAPHAGGKALAQGYLILRLLTIGTKLPRAIAAASPKTCTAPDIQLTWSTG